jgi:SAM-dependent methyltransferase
MFELHAAMEDRHWWFQARRHIVRRLAHHVVRPGVGRLVIDVGCGTGASVAEMSHDYRTVGIEPSESAVTLARKRFPSHEFIHGHAPRDLGELATTADLFLFMDVLEHIPDEVALLSETVEAARTGAHILITVPADPRLWSEHDLTHRHYRRYVIDSLPEIWRGLPVSVRLLSYYNSRLYPLVRLARMLSRKRGHSAGAGSTDLSLPPDPINRLLARIFGGEGNALVRHLEGDGKSAYPFGVSLVAILRRESGSVVPRSRAAEGTLVAEPPTDLRPSPARAG